MMLTSPMVMASRQPDGRHWITTLDFPPLQIWPVAANHCRVGCFLAKLVSSKLPALAGSLPQVIKLSGKDAKKNPSLATQYPELVNSVASVDVQLIAKAAPGEEDTQDDGLGEFVTPQPPKTWKQSYDDWIVHVGRKLGLDVPDPCGTEGYDQAMTAASGAVQKQLRSLRDRFLSGLDGANLGLKLALSTRKGGKEYVWARVTGWQDEENAAAVLESQPHDCKGYKAGQKLNVASGDIIDYCIGSPEKGIVDAGLTQRIAEDYGLVLPG